MDVHLYALSTCPYCRMAREFLAEHHIAYELTEVDLLDDESRGKTVAEVRRLSGGEAFPVLIAGGKVVVGFDPARMADALGLQVETM